MGEGHLRRPRALTSSRSCGHGAWGASQAAIDRIDAAVDALGGVALLHDGAHGQWPARQPGGGRPRERRSLLRGALRATIIMRRGLRWRPGSACSWIFLDATTIVSPGLQWVVGANSLTMAMLMMDVGITSRVHGFTPARLTLG